MLLYHGSPRIFSNFRLEKELCLHDVDTVLTEGMGIYLTENKNIAMSYGSILYHVQVDEGVILDMTNKEGVYFVLNRLFEDLSTIGTDVNDYMRQETIDNMSRGMLEGDLSCTNIDREIGLTLDSEESFYTDGNDCEEVNNTLENSMGDILNKYIIKFNDPNLGVIYIAKNVDLLKIVDKEVI